MNKSIHAMLVASSIAFVTTISGCDEHERREQFESETRDLGSFSAVDLRGAAAIKIAVGQPEALKIEGSNYAVKGLRTEVRDNTLHIDAKKSGWAWFGDDEEVKLTISMPKLTSLRSNGAGNIDVTGLNGGDQEVRISGAHNLEASGQLDKLTLEMNGAGNVDYGKVSSQDATVTVNGAGQVLVRVSQTLSATMNGVGAIHYEGEPQKVESNLHGIGTISRK
jgi:hypothetical protein